MPRWRWLEILTALVCAASAVNAAGRDLRSASDFLSADLKRQQADETLNPGMLWVGEGEQLWRQAEGASGKSCSSCHGDARASMRGVAARYPAVDEASGKLFNLELRIMNCRNRNQKGQPLVYESEELLALTSYVARQSLGVPLSVRADGTAASYYEKGRSLFYLRQGQINLACANCHEDHMGRRLRGDTMSSAVPAGYPVYRLEWQTLGSLHRRLRACALGVRAIQFPYGSEEYVSLELYLAKRAEGFAIETPALRK